MTSWMHLMPLMQEHPDLAAWEPGKVSPPNSSAHAAPFDPERLDQGADPFLGHRPLGAESAAGVAALLVAPRRSLQVKQCLTAMGSLRP